MSFSTSDTIVAIATPAGRGGLGVVRISGQDARRIAGLLVGRKTPFAPRHATFCCLREPSNGTSGSLASDRVIVTVFPAPGSYTGEDVAEVSAHGSPVVLAAILRRSIDAGARLAEPGEFTLRSFLHGKLDLIQAEAVADLIEAVTPLQARAAFDQLEGTLTHTICGIESELFDLIAKLEASLDFPDEGYHFLGPRDAESVLSRVIGRIDELLAQAASGRLLREGAQVAIIGAPNVGKSSLFNALLNANRAIVTEVPGTTRDMLTEQAEIGGLSVTLVDTAGVRDTTDRVEQEGVARARDAQQVADLLLVVLDRSRPIDDDDRRLLHSTVGRPRVVVANKADLPPAWSLGDASGLPEPAIEISVRTRQGLEDLRSTMTCALVDGEPLRDRPEVTNVRHAVLLDRARGALARAGSAIANAVPEEFPLIDLQDAAEALQEITGRRTTDELLAHIFGRFCIGK